MQLALIIAYPFCVHFAVIFNRPELSLLALIVLAVGLCYQGLKAKSLFAWSVILVLGMLALAFNYFQLTMYILYVPPVVIPLLVGGIFFRSLMPGQTPLVTAIGENVHGPFDQPLRAYTRLITLLWTVLFAATALWSILLAVFAADELWSLVTNFVNYILVGIFFVVEFIYRKWRFKHMDHPAFFQYLRIVFSAEIRKL